MSFSQGQSHSQQAWSPNYNAPRINRNAPDHPLAPASTSNQIAAPGMLTPAVVMATGASTIASGQTPPTFTFPATNSTWAPVPAGISSAFFGT